MASKKYTLELTADELFALQKWRDGRGCVLTSTAKQIEGVDVRVASLISQATADKEADDDLRLPWRAISVTNTHWQVRRRPSLEDGLEPSRSETSAKLMSAAPELLEFAQEVKELWDRNHAVLSENAVRLLKRALRKVETGVPDEG